MSRKMPISIIFLSSIAVGLSLLNVNRTFAQSDYDEFLNQVYSLSVNNCQPQGSQCSNCAESLTRNIIQQNRISDRRMQQDIYNAALDACN